MATVIPFTCIRPCREKVSHIAALPYDVYSRKEAKEETLREPESFLKIDRAETQFDDTVDTYAPEVYKRAHDTLWGMVSNGDFITEEKPCFYIYELTWEGRSQTGITACVSIDDYIDGTVKKHENTRRDKEEDRIRHVDICNAQTGPVFLAYRYDAVIGSVTRRIKKTPPEYDFSSMDGVTHRVWVISSESDIETLKAAFGEIKNIYIADGHHRAASAVEVGKKRRLENPDYDGTEGFNYFLCVLFPDEELRILDYNRVVNDLNGMSDDEFLSSVQNIFDVAPLTNGERRPPQKGSFTMYLSEKWYLCQIRDKDCSVDPVKGLDVSLLQDLLLSPVLGIKDPKSDRRIDFVGGIRGIDELERRCHADAKVAFAMYPVSIQDLFAVADAGFLMPPKSTWFEPKLRSGLFIHALE